MEKKVYCLIGERCKSIKFSSRNGISDAQIVHDRLLEVAKNDVVLQTMIQNKIVIFQKHDPDRNNKLCDIEDDDEIENKSEIRVLLFENSSIVKPQTTIFDVSKDLQIDVGEKYEYKIIHTQPMNLDSDDLPSLGNMHEYSIDGEQKKDVSMSHNNSYN